MTDLAYLLAVRNTALTATAKHKRPLRQLVPSERLEAELASETFREADAAIVLILRERSGPVAVGDRELHLTADRLNFAEVDLATGEPIDRDTYSQAIGKSWTDLLYRYPARQAS